MVTRKSIDFTVEAIKYMQIASPFRSGADPQPISRFFLHKPPNPYLREISLQHDKLSFRNLHLQVYQISFDDKVPIGLFYLFLRRDDLTNFDSH